MDNFSYFCSMSTKEIIEGIKQLPFQERLIVIEKAIKSLHATGNSKLEKAAKALMADYKNDKNLTAFTTLDFEDFYEAR
jgi:hypothetical protein